MPETYKYRYPNARSYNQLPVSRQHGNFKWQGRSLRHGYIFGYKPVQPPPEGPLFAAAARAVSFGRQIDFQNSKVFQFNPPALGMNVEMMNTDSAANEAAGGALSNTAGVGMGAFSMELFFDRTEEIARANTRLNRGQTYAGDEIWRDLGVQVDLFEFLKVISGGDASQLTTYTDPGNPDTSFPGTVQAGSLNHLTGAFLDAASTGSKIMMNSFVMVFNPNLAIHVNRMLSFAFTYVRFTSDLVPTTVQLVLNLEIFNMGTKSYVAQVGSGNPVAGGQTTAPPGVNTGSDIPQRPVRTDVL